MVKNKILVCTGSFTINTLTFYASEKRAVYTTHQYKTLYRG